MCKKCVKNVKKYNIKKISNKLYFNLLEIERKNDLKIKLKFKKFR